MKVIIAGTRDVSDMRCLLKALEVTAFQVSTILSGGARGIDTLAYQYGKRHNIPVELYPADWDNLGRAAGPIRNDQMAEAGDALIALWDGVSPGTKNMIDAMKARGKPVEVYLVPNCTKL